LLSNLHFCRVRVYTHRITVHDADLRADLVETHERDVLVADHLGDLAEALAELTCLEADAVLVVVSLEFRLRGRSSDAVPHDHDGHVLRGRLHLVDDALDDRERVLDAPGLAVDEALRDVNTELTEVLWVDGVLGIDINCDTTHTLSRTTDLSG
jgi:hypothetical protein